MPRQNRVTPAGDLLAVPDRGLFWGNRGCLLDAGGELARHHRGRGWVICLLEFKGRRRQLWRPGRLTELFFLDEATGLAAGHRPCGECRDHDYRRFRALWAEVHPDDDPRAPAIDARLHADRLGATGVQRTYSERLAALPDGAMVRLDDETWLVCGSRLLQWTPGGYSHGRSRSSAPLEVAVQTPRATVAVLAAGYRPVVHASAVA